MANNEVKFNINDIGNIACINVTITGVKFFNFRIKLASLLIKVASYLINCECNITIV